MNLKKAKCSKKFRGKHPQFSNRNIRFAMRTIKSYDPVLDDWDCSERTWNNFGKKEESKKSLRELAIESLGWDLGYSKGVERKMNPIQRKAEREFYKSQKEQITDLNPYGVHC